MRKKTRTEWIETALKLFAKKGYHSTSIQDIVEAWGISKGAFYHHFSSKEDLMLAIVKQHFEKLNAALLNAQSKDRAEKESLVEQIRLYLDNMCSNKEFFQLLFEEQLPKISQDLRLYLFKQRFRMLNWFSGRIVELYGEKAARYALDAAAILIGMIREYMFYILITSGGLRSEEIARFIVRRLDAVIAGFEPHEPPVLKKEMFEQFAEIEKREREKQKKEIGARIAHLKKTLAALKLDAGVQHQLFSAFDALEAELMNEQGAPKEPVVEGILLYIENHKIQPIASDLTALRKIVHEYFTHYNR